MDKSDGNENITEERDLPWLQDEENTDLWTQWEAVYRDVYLIAPDSSYHSQYNLSTFDLSDEDNKETLKEALISLAEEEIAP